MKIKVISTGKSAPEAEKLIQEMLDTMGDIEIKHVSVSNLKTFVFYEEKACKEKNASGIIQSKSNQEGGAQDASKNSASDKGRGAKNRTPRRSKKS